MLNEGLIQSFLTLADTLNFTEAARKLFFTQQALSKQIAKLEQELGSDLFQRDRNHVSLTREGEIYHAAFRESMRLVLEAREEVAKLHDLDSTLLTIGHLEMLGLPQAWKEFYHSFCVWRPEFEIRFLTFREPDLVGAILNGEVEAAILIYKPEDCRFSDLSYTELYEESTNLCVHADYPGVRSAKHYYDLMNVPIFFSGTRPEDAEHRMREIGFPSESIRYTSSLSAGMLEVELLKGATLVSDSCEFRNNSNLRFFPIPSARMRVVFAWKKGNTKKALNTFTNDLSSFLKTREN